jgi:phenylalanyl-tRNA synthetase beta chain
LGFRSLETYSFVPDALVTKLGLQDQQYVTLANSLVAGESRVRREIVPSLLGIVRKNLGVEAELRLFEVGKGYDPGAKRADSYVGSDAREPREMHVAAGILARRKTNDRAAGPGRGLFFDLKGIVASLIEGLDANARFFDSSEVARLAGANVGGAAPHLHPKRLLFMGSGASGGGDLFGRMAEIHPQALARLDLADVDVAMFEIDLARLEAARASAGPQRFAGIPKFPGVAVDVALLAPAARTVADLEALVRAADPQLCRGVELFDVYAGAELGEGRRSVAFHVEIRSDERTLTDADEANFLKALAVRGAKEGITLRGWSG